MIIIGCDKDILKKNHLIKYVADCNEEKVWTTEKKAKTNDIVLGYLLNEVSSIKDLNKHRHVMNLFNITNLYWFNVLKAYTLKLLAQKNTTLYVYFNFDDVNYSNFNKLLRFTIKFNQGLIAFRIHKKKEHELMKIVREINNRKGLVLIVH